MAWYSASGRDTSVAIPKANTIQQRYCRFATAAARSAPVFTLFLVNRCRSERTMLVPVRTEASMMSFQAKFSYEIIPSSLSLETRGSPATIWR